MKEHLNPKGRQVYKEMVVISRTQIQIVERRDYCIRQETMWIKHTQDSKTLEMLPTVLTLNATQHTVSNQNSIPSLRDTINTAKNSVSIINKDVDI